VPNLKELSDKELRERKGDLIWQRGSAREIMSISREQYKRMKRKGAVLAAHVMMASDHYSLVKRYVSWWKKPTAAWHFGAAVIHAKISNRLGLKNFHQADVVATVLSRFPPERELARQILEKALNYVPVNEPQDEMDPHTRASMLIRRAEVEWKQKNVAAAWSHLFGAEDLIPAIETENSPDRERQLVRVKKDIGLFYWRHGGPRGDLKPRGMRLITEAYALAKQVALDQAEHILVEAEKIGFTVLR
jgi:hypothetical protein